MNNIVRFERIYAALCLLLLSLNLYASDIPIAQMPLVASGGAPDNLVILPSVEYPTINSVANISNTYNINESYSGYFDSEKCYKYRYSYYEPDRHFYPVRWTNNHRCGRYREWSGNFLNWATTQTIDPFRSTMTGGYRVVDTATETWLEKARHSGQGALHIFPNRRLPSSGSNSSLIWYSTPFYRNYLRMRVHGLGNKMRFVLNGDNIDDPPYSFNPSYYSWSGYAYEVSVRVKVCVEGLLEDNCEPYDYAHKPEGLMQEYSGRLRYSVFGYLNDSNIKRDGAVLRARQKSIGPNKASISQDDSQINNPRKEWDPDTGVIYTNPDKDDAANTSKRLGITINNSGALNYINKVGQTTNKSHKLYDPVSEMFYAGTRYLRNLDNINTYSNMNYHSSETKRKFADGFPVITEWQDPYIASCQASAFLGIGDTFTNPDKNLPGNNSYRADEPSQPMAVATDTIDVRELTNQIGQLEGLGNIGDTNSFNGNYKRNNSTYIAGLAWYANTQDIRPDLDSKQTVATFWVDVLEARSLLGTASNPYVLATKYGGFRVPEGFEPNEWDQALPEQWWYTNEDILTPFGYGDGQPAFKRPDNFFTAGEASQMEHSLKQAFARVIARVNGSGVGLASNTTRLEAGARVYQALFYNKSWHGEIKALGVDTETGKLAKIPEWLATENVPDWTERNIYIGATPFKWDLLNGTQRSLLESERLTNYLRGDNSHEQRNGGDFRDRYISVLGDIVHSQPILAGTPNPEFYSRYNFTGASSYRSFANEQKERKDILYVGANDGMLHGFDSETGQEHYAFIPNEALRKNVKQLADPAYKHRYFVDGELTVADAYIQGQWKTILVGTMGRGGQSIFALDITNPNDIRFLWEKTAADSAAIGNVLSKPLITQTADGVWQVVIGNGLNSQSGRAQLLMIELGNGRLTTIDTYAGNGNGLGGVAGWSSQDNGITDIFYAGDLKGNLWEIPISGSPRKIFNTSPPSGTAIQPVYVTPLIGKHKNGQIWLFFGTGQYLSQTDLTDKAPQTWYGLKVLPNEKSSRDNMLQRKILVEQEEDSVAVRVTEIGTEEELADKDGWYIDLPTTGERMTVPNIFQQDVLIGTVRIPNTHDICKPTGRGFVIAINPFTGGRLDRIFFDINNDRKFDEKDNVTMNGESIPVSGLGFNSSPNAPIFIGSAMQIVEDDGTAHSILTQTGRSVAQITSWREIINH